MKKYVCKIYSTVPVRSRYFRVYDESLFDVKIIESSRYSDFTLSDVHRYFVNCLLRHRDVPSGSYRVTTSVTRSSVVMSSYVNVY